MTSSPSSGSFHPTLVLAQLTAPASVFSWLWFPSHIGSRSTNTPRPTLFSRQVSIPHWFSLNERDRETEDRHPVCFHPTLVLAQRDDDDDLVSIFWKFPSHIGSRSTRNYFRGTINRHVSIPHWFSLNETATPVYSFQASFHPTLVLAQLGDPALGRNIFGFHPTLVLAQPMKITIIGGMKTFVSIPHWFSLNRTA